jgi:hypothetical protein
VLLFLGLWLVSAKLEFALDAVGFDYGDKHDRELFSMEATCFVVSCRCARRVICAETSGEAPAGILLPASQTHGASRNRRHRRARRMDNHRKMLVGLIVCEAILQPVSSHSLAILLFHSHHFVARTLISISASPSSTSSMSFHLGLPLAFILISRFSPGIGCTTHPKRYGS